jgi:hypothetical protein
MMAELFQHVAQHQVIVETIIGEQEDRIPFHWKEEQGKTSTPPPHPFLVHQCRYVSTLVPYETPF